MFKFKFERKPNGDYEALLDRKWSNLDRSDDEIERMGGEIIEGVALKIVIETELYYGEKYYRAYLRLNYSVIDELGSGYTLKDCKEMITEWFVEHFFELALADNMPSYIKRDCEVAKEYYFDWCNFRTSRQEEWSKARKAEKAKEVAV